MVYVVCEYRCISPQLAVSTHMPQYVLVVDEYSNQHMT